MWVLFPYSVVDIVLDDLARIPNKNVNIAKQQWKHYS